GLDRREEVPVVVVDDVRLAAQEVQRRVGEDLALALGDENRDAEPRGATGSRGVVAEEVRARERNRRRRQLTEMLEPEAGRGGDDEATLRPFDRIHVAAVAEAEDAG